MKLRHKISLLSGGVLLLILALCAGFLLVYARAPLLHPLLCPLLPKWLAPENSQSVRTQRTQEMGQFLLHPAGPPSSCSSLAHHPGSYTLKTWGSPHHVWACFESQGKPKEPNMPKCGDLSLVVQWLRLRATKAGGTGFNPWSGN